MILGLWYTAEVMQKRRLLRLCRGLSSLDMHLSPRAFPGFTLRHRFLGRGM
jgi:hypothetical protein